MVNSRTGRAISFTVKYLGVLFEYIFLKKTRLARIVVYKIKETTLRTYTYVYIYIYIYTRGETEHLRADKTVGSLQ